VVRNDLRWLTTVNTKHLFVMTAATEAATGLALLLSPSAPISILLGSQLDTLTELVLGRVAGMALLALGVACWLARDDGKSRAGAGLIAAMLLYNTVATAILAYAGIGLRMFGVGLWPAVLLHLTLVVWCFACLRIELANIGIKMRRPIR
jgi:hypothetical protein